MKLISFGDITQKAKNAFNRFPITLSWAIIGSLFVMCIINIHGELLFTEYLAYSLTLILGVSWLIGIQFFTEQFKLPDNKIWIKGVGVALLILFCFHFPPYDKDSGNTQYIIRFFLLLLAGHLFVLFAPFVLRWERGAFWNYLKYMSIAIGRSALFSAVLYLGLALALLAIKHLFGLDIPEKRYGQLFVFCLGIVNTWTYLADFPEQVNSQTAVRYNKALEVFVKYILIPLVILYLLILYAYGLKILLEWDLPKGWVSNLVTALALLGFAVQLAIDPVQRTIKAWTARKFYPWFYLLLLPLVVLLFVAILRRINDYGITENRYFIFLTACWIFVMTSYLLLSRKKQLRILPISLFVLAILSVFGPWSAYNISVKSQLKEFKETYTSLREKDSVSEEDENKIRSITNYLQNRNKLDKLQPLIGFNPEEAFKEENRWSITNKLLDSLNIQSSKIAQNTYYFDTKSDHTVNISGYHLLKTINFSKYNAPKDPLGFQKIGLYPVRLDHKKNILEIIPPDVESLKADLNPLMKELVLSNYTDHNNIPREHLTIETYNKHLKIKLIFEHLNFEVKDNSYFVNNCRVIILLKEQ